MAKWFGKIGFATSKETSDGVWVEDIETRSYYGDVTRYSRRLESSSDSINDNININNVISILADPFANENINAMRYAEYMNAKWKISNVDVQYPRLNLTLGGLYNE